MVQAHLARQGDGKVVVAGTAAPLASDQLAMLRFNPDGSLDAAFNGGGVLVVALPVRAGDDWCAGLAIQKPDRQDSDCRQQ